MKRYAWAGAALLVLAVLGFVMLGSGRPDRGEKLSEGYTKEPVIRVEVSPGESSKVKLEEYIAGVVAGEMKPGWPLETYKAQSIVARSYAVNQLTEGGQQPIGNGTIKAEHTEAQAYKPSAVTPIIRRAVQETRGRIMTYKGYPIKAYFHSASGGKTAKAEDAGLVQEGQEPPYIKQVTSANEDRYAPPEVRAWNASFTTEEVGQALKEVTGRPLTGVEDVRITRKDDFGRAVQMSIVHDGGQTSVKAADLRLAMGPERMRSTLINRLEVQGGRVVMAGKGFGHGVGLSQYGAYAMAKSGANADQIVKHYFPSVQIEQSWK